jgi:hypothetical protein
MALDVLQEVTRDEAVFLGIAVSDPHDALAVPQQFPDPAGIEAGNGSPQAVDFDQIVAEGVGPGQVEAGQHAVPLQAGEVVNVGGSLDILGEEEELLGLAERKESPFLLEGSDIDRTGVTGQAVEGMIVPQQHLGAVRHVVVPVRPRRDRFQDGFPALPRGLVLHQDRHPVPVSLDGARLDLFPEEGESKDADRLLQEGGKVGFEVFPREIGHGAPAWITRGRAFRLRAPAGWERA